MHSFNRPLLIGTPLKTPVKGMVTPGGLPLDAPKPIIFIVFASLWGGWGPLETYELALCQILTLGSALYVTRDLTIFGSHFLPNVTNNALSY